MLTEADIIKSIVDKIKVQMSKVINNELPLHIAAAQIGMIPSELEYCYTIVMKKEAKNAN